jgi:hypothetical protein
LGSGDVGMENGSRWVVGTQKINRKKEAPYGASFYILYYE